jgi:hypothetical protein
MDVPIGILLHSCIGVANKTGKEKKKGVRVPSTFLFDRRQSIKRTECYPVPRAVGLEVSLCLGLAALGTKTPLEFYGSRHGLGKARHGRVDRVDPKSDRPI